MSELWVMSGIMGSGKSTFIRNHMSAGDVWISRDTIRLAMISPDEAYFSKEDEVFNEFVKQINDALNSSSLNGIVFADATHNTKKSRAKLLNRITAPIDRLVCVFMDTSTNLCLKRNELRRNTREYVPRGVIRRAAIQQEIPTKREGFDAVYTVTEGKNE